MLFVPFPAKLAEETWKCTGSKAVAEKVPFSRRKVPPHPRPSQTDFGGSGKVIGQRPPRVPQGFLDALLVGSKVADLEARDPGLLEVCEP